MIYSMRRKRKDFTNSIEEFIKYIRLTTIPELVKGKTIKDFSSIFYHTIDDKKKRELKYKNSTKGQIFYRKRKISKLFMYMIKNNLTIMKANHSDMTDQYEKVLSQEVFTDDYEKYDSQVYGIQNHKMKDEVINFLKYNDSILKEYTHMTQDEKSHITLFMGNLLSYLKIKWKNQRSDLRILNKIN